MYFFGLAASAALFVIGVSLEIPTSETQHALMMTSVDTRPQTSPIRGDNSAHYAGDVPPQDQLFKIIELDVLPNSPRVDHRFFIFMGGDVPDVPGLEDAVLSMTSDSEVEGHGHRQIKLAKMESIRFRQRREYLPALRPGLMEIVWDGFYPAMFIHQGNYTFTIEARIPDGRVLFCIQQEVYLAGEL